MSATYRVTFADGWAVYVASADARSYRTKDLRAAYAKARAKAKAKRKKAGLPAVAVTACNCVG